MIKQLFESSISGFYYPIIIKLIYHEVDKNQNINPSENLQIIVSASKKRFRKAVDRNKIKRRVKEAFRKSKYRLKLTDPKLQKISEMAIIYCGNEICSQLKINNALEIALTKVQDHK